MKVTALLFACLAVSAYGSRLESIFEDVGKTDFGKTMITSIELQLKSGEMVDGVIANVNQVSDSLKGQLENAEAAYGKQNAECQADIMDLSAGLSQAMVDVDKYQALMDMDTATLSSRVEELDTKKVSLTARKDMLNVLHTQREAERVRFESSMQEYGVVFGLIDSVKDVINTKLVSGSGEFLENKASMEMGIINLIENFEVKDNGGVAHKHFGFFKVMANIMVKSMEKEVHANQEIVEELLAICDRIQENLSIAESTERLAESTRQADYEELADKVNKQIAYVMSQLQELTRVINTLNSRIEGLSENAEHSNETADNFRSRLDDRNEECNVVQNVWETFYNSISAELSTCGKLTYLVEDKRALLARYGL